MYVYRASFQLFFLYEILYTFMIKGDFSKSLKLLGVEVESNRKEATKLTHHQVCFLGEESSHS